MTAHSLASGREGGTCSRVIGGEEGNVCPALLPTKRESFSGFKYIKVGGGGGCLIMRSI